MRLDENILRNELGVDWDIRIFIPADDGNASELYGIIYDIGPVVEYANSQISRTIKLREDSGKYIGMIHEYTIHSDILNTEFCPQV